MRPRTTTPTPALNDLEIKAMTLVTLVRYWLANGDSPLLRDARWEARRAFVKAEAEYLGTEPEFDGCTKRAEELCEGL
jgi:hypothetical protein